MNCPICENELETLGEAAILNTESRWCAECQVELIKYPSTNSEIQRSGFYALIPLARYPKDDWCEFLLTARNIYGKVIEDHLPFFVSPEERELVEKQRAKKLEKISEWGKLVG